MENAPIPHMRPRRLRANPLLRNALAEVSVHPSQLVYPLFVGDLDQPRPVASMPEVMQWPVGKALNQIASLSRDGLTQFILFGVTPADRKDEQGSFADDPDAPVNRLLTEVRERDLNVVMWADLCYCEYTTHGHCGCLPVKDQSGNVDNDATLERLAQTAAVQANAGADVIAPSGMMDGMVTAIRNGLDSAGHMQLPVCSYAIKYASHFYGPFREAGEGGMAFGDRKGYQMDFRRSREWLTELELDLAEGADMVMVKPAHAYLDIIRQVRDACSAPVAAYHVSGEYSMLHAAAANGWLDLRQTALEVTTAIRRAGADLVLTYFAPQLLTWL